MAPKRSFGRFVAPFAASLGVVLFGFVLLFDRSNPKSQVPFEAQLEKAFGGRPLLEAYPPHSKNETAQRLDALTASLGLGAADSPWPWDEKRGVYAADRRRTQIHWLRTRLFDRWLGALDPLDPESLALLEEARPILAESTALLVAMPPPTWPRDLAREGPIKIPKYGSLVSFQTLLLLDASERARSGERAAVFERLEASWRLHQAVADEPYLDAQEVGTEMAKLGIWLFRGLTVPAVWRERFVSLKLRAPLARALRVEAARLALTARSKTVGGLHPRILARWILLDRAKRFAAWVEAVEKADLLTFDLAAFDREAERRLSTWPMDSDARIGPDTWELWPRAAELELAAELTALGMGESARFASGGAPRGFDRKPSRIAGIDWIFREANEDGQFGTWIEPSAEMAYRSTRPLPTRLFVPREARVL